MWEYLKNAEWDFWAVVLAVVAIIVSIVIYLLQRNKKELVWEITTNTLLLSNADNSVSNLKVYFKDELVVNPSILIFKITNNSNSAIVASDFETNFKFICHGAKILEATIDDQTKGLNPVHNFSDNEVSIKPLLLNSKDFFAIKILSSRPISDKNFSFSARIKDIKEIKQTSNSIFKKKLLDFLWLAPVTAFVSVIITGSQYETVIIFLLPIIIMVITILLFIYNIKK